MRTTFSARMAAGNQIFMFPTAVSSDLEVETLFGVFSCQIIDHLFGPLKLQHLNEISVSS